MGYTKIDPPKKMKKEESKTDLSVIQEDATSEDSKVEVEGNTNTKKKKKYKTKLKVHPKL